MSVSGEPASTAIAAPEKACEADDTIWYFAIGAMINPTSLRSRNIRPVASRPAEIQDHRLRFFGGTHAEAVPEKGASFHGVLHRLSSGCVAALDKVEIDYVRRDAVARCYDGEFVRCTVYVKSTSLEGEAESVGESGPESVKVILPDERYLEIIILGCEHYGVNEAFVDSLRNHECQPRPAPSEFLSFGKVPEGAPRMTLEQVEKCNGKGEMPLYCTVNSKVVEFTVDRDSKIFTELAGVHSHFGQCLELFISRVVFDPKYGQPEALRDFTREHSAYCEDTAYRYQQFRGVAHAWKPIAHFPQEYKD